MINDIKPLLDLDRSTAPALERRNTIKILDTTREINRKIMHLITSEIKTAKEHNRHDTVKNLKIIFTIHRTDLDIRNAILSDIEMNGNRAVPFNHFSNRTNENNDALSNSPLMQTISYHSPGDMRDKYHDALSTIPLDNKQIVRNYIISATQRFRKNEQ